MTNSLQIENKECVSNSVDDSHRTNTEIQGTS